MTPLELRIKFKSETGFAPTTGRTHEQQVGSCNYREYLTQEYIGWLESDHIDIKMGNKYREKYFKETGKQAISYDNKRNICYINEYDEWLEEKICDALTLLND